MPARPSRKRAPSEPGLLYKLASSPASQRPPLPSSVLAVLCLGEGRLTDVSEEAAARQAPVTRLTRPCPLGWVGPAAQMALSHLFCGVLGCTHWGLKPHTLTVSQSWRPEPGIKASGPCPAGGSHGGTPCLPQLRVPQGTPVITSLQVILIHCDHRLPLRGRSHSLSLT